MTCNLVLSGGGVRGYAHIGAIKALLEKNIGFDSISATSSGAIVGAFLCDGFSPLEIIEILTLHKPKLKVNLLHLRDSLLNFNAMSELLKKNLRSRNIEDLQKQLFISLTNLNTGRPKFLDHGNLVEVLTASSSLPVFFPAVKIDGIPYMDGGMSNNLPVDPLIGKQNKIIGIHVNPVINYTESPGLRQTIDRTMHIIVLNACLPSIGKCDVFIEPPALVNYHIFELDKADEIIKIGYDYVADEADLASLIF